MNLQLLMLLGGLGFVYATSKAKTPPSAQGPTTPANTAGQTSGQPGIQNFLSGLLQGVGLGSKTAGTPATQTTNQSQYGGNKAFMGTPSAPVTTQIANAAAGVNWGAVGTSAASVWNNLFGSQQATNTPAATDPSADGTVTNDVVDPQPDLSTAMNGSDTVDASSAFDNAPDYLV